MKAFWRKKEYEKQKEATFLRNGRIVFEKSIALCDGKCNPIRNFSASELMTATNNYAQILCGKRIFKTYQGFLGNRPISVKKWGVFVKKCRNQEVFNEIVYSSKLGSHKNVLKLIGCCLETQVPILVFEPVQAATLADRIKGHHYGAPMLYKCRMKIAMDIAHVVAYLHSAFSEPIVHRDIKPSNILLDEQNVTKLSNLSLCVSIPKGETHIEDQPVGTLEFISPESLTSARINEKHDVFSFGVCLLILLTGNPLVYVECSLVDNVKYLIENNRVDEITDPIIQEEGSWPGKQQQLKAFATIAIRCVSQFEDDRPTMIDVAKELRQIHRSLDSLP
ncbi:hypothetical protein HS088_TW12G01092 [Tripterygium wilfordii]|uniref:Protein kinase domain-containing protein n=1 Tax=Tripterygium wilfordii TaxID=458696 RepID=A0A7J7D0M0_TRIWF|nr:non-functional pseudokinase ZED1-like [Tripterygium wilfordii]XP_038717390.1 non-functional pseudokinase ZED1-like [Tripterygium wilfordii]KAF5739881.1 hypothetical protein HS088_TW12G01092 [Tripterygium wilfordii]